MNHGQAFLQAIREAPDDDAPRLIYADWLEEQGGASRAARADFIRIQCRLDELPEDDPARDRLEDEATDLLAEHEAEWSKPLHGIAEDWRFTRGFLEHIRIRGENLLAHAERLFDFAPLRSLHLLIPRNDVPHLAACPQLRWVSTLDFSLCQLNDRSLQQLLVSPLLGQVTALNLSGNDISTAGMQSLIHSPLFSQLHRLNLSHDRGIGDRAVHLLARASRSENLQELNLAATNATTDALQELLQSSQLPRLVKLDISRARRGFGSPLRMFAVSPLLGQLRSLDVSESYYPAGVVPILLDALSTAQLQDLHMRRIHLTSQDARTLANSRHLSALATLDLRESDLGAEGAQALAYSYYLTSLKHLNLSHNNIRDTGAKAITESLHLRHLRVLNLSGNGIGGPGLKALAASANLDRLRSLYLAGNFVGADSVRALAESEHLRNLTCLDLSDASLEEDSARSLASSANLTRLTTLLLKKNLLGDGGAKALAQAPHLARLTSLDLNDNRIGKAGAEALAAASWRRMRKLDLRGNVFTDTQEALLRQRFGNAVQL